MPPQDPSLELASPNASTAEEDGTPRYAMRGQGGRLFHDRAGLCSQGNRRPAFREVSHFTSLGEEFLKLTTEEEMRRDLYRLALEKCEAPPFGEGVVEKAKNLWLGSL